MRSIIATLSLCLLATAVQAQPQRYSFAGDRYAWGGMADDVLKAIKAKKPQAAKPKPRKPARKPGKVLPADYRSSLAALPRPRPSVDDPDQIEAYRVIANLIADGKVVIAKIEVGGMEARATASNLASGFLRELRAAFAPPRRFIHAPLSCARNVNAALAENGIRGTGSAWAKSFLRWGRPSGPVPGAVAIYHRGRNPKNGHVAIVAKIVRGVVHVWNPGRKGWRMIAYRKRAIAYRVAV